MYIQNRLVSDDAKVIQLMAKGSDTTTPLMQDVESDLNSPESVVVVLDYNIKSMAREKLDFTAIIEAHIAIQRAAIVHRWRDEQPYSIDRGAVTF